MSAQNSTIYVINPNSSTVVTAGIDAAMEPLRPCGLRIECVTLEGTPKGIQTQRDVDSIDGPLLNRAAQLEDSACGFVVACFSDPGMFALREQSRHPVLGIAECGMLTAMSLGQRIGVISILSTSIPRHMRLFGAMGIMDRIAADRAIGMGVADLADDARAVALMSETGRMLRDEDGADVLVMGCAGMARFRAAVEQAVGIPVVEPTQAAVGMMIGRVSLGWAGKTDAKAAR
ncbi:Asp/Glu racemase [Paracoccus suum]|uniref:Asp/Glu racemase n=1 Tax=Paracoccus suum TaxID=2259340 RepID=A0A344PLC6_9RHOB|nr:aspartate/glutamate racemase family protein [Paracoccus suum]AXC50181.1 Asp/Glu racemase [Paracoccus suum]